MSSWKTIALAAFISFAATNMLVVLSNLGRSRTQFAEANSVCSDGNCKAEISVDVGQGTRDVGFRNEILQSFLIK